MNKIKNIIAASIEVKQQILQDDAFTATIQQCVDTITQAFKNGNKVLLCGNGRSAADAQHLAAEFTSSRSYCCIINSHYK